MGFSHLFESKAGRNGGTWGHPKFAVFFARWLDTKFAVWCDMVIDDLLNKKAVLSIQKPEESMALKVPQSLPEALENPIITNELKLRSFSDYLLFNHSSGFRRPLLPERFT